MTLFQLHKGEKFQSHSGNPLSYKIECDALTPEDWDCLGYMAIQLLASDVITDKMDLPSVIIGVPRGGNRLARAMNNHVSWSYANHTYRCIVDDVLTTGRSMLQHMIYPTDIGLVVFARIPTPPKVFALFQMPEGMSQ